MEMRVNTEETRHGGRGEEKRWCKRLRMRWSARRRRGGRCPLRRRRSRRARSGDAGDGRAEAELLQRAGVEFAGRRQAIRLLILLHRLNRGRIPLPCRLAGVMAGAGQRRLHFRDTFRSWGAAAAGFSLGATVLPRMGFTGGTSRGELMLRLRGLRLRRFRLRFLRLWHPGAGGASRKQKKRQTRQESPP